MFENELKEVEKAIKATLVVENRDSIKYALKRIEGMFNKVFADGYDEGLIDGKKHRYE
jgi:hypothetical protein